jgi:DNA-binding Lrp family transcriptional regulator
MQDQGIDQRDRAILRELMRDSHLTNAELAERVNLSPSACLRRVRAME